MVLQFLVQLSLLSFMVSYAKAGGFWDHSSVGHGPSTWAKEWPRCNGTRQSPIDIETSKAKHDSNLGNITFNNYEEPTNVTFTAANNGHGFQVTFSGFTSQNEPTIEGGGLPGTFKLLGYHFHWGKNNEDGSEHHLNLFSYGCEFHMVHMNTKYASVAEAKNNTDGLAVLGVLVKVGEKNDVFDNFLNFTKYNVTYPNMNATVKPFNLMSLIPSNQSFYRYNGSLTTPGCNEVVTWTVFADNIECSPEQLDEFRKMMYLEGNKSHPIEHIHRPIQPLNGREVKANFEVYVGFPKPNTTASSNTTAFPSTTSSHRTTSSPTEREVLETTCHTDDSNGISGDLMLMTTSLFLVAIWFLKI